jgi:hypothetical protein
MVRGEAEPAEWEETKTLARKQHDRLFNRDLLGHPDVGKFIMKGLQKTVAFGLD